MDVTQEAVIQFEGGMGSMAGMTGASTDPLPGSLAATVDAETKEVEMTDVWSSGVNDGASKADISGWQYS